ncbi:hypothetical protein IAR55_007173 [Kwoniella newhampshirensis]|uniref:Xylose isomerase-like TIM barrel domain-containing protein n=1 Tax=Kwoniella newhampshirensis TaxID=1651941 RepID=A0AAW0YWE5_9TREE
MSAITRTELRSLPTGYATPCLGLNPAHTLEMKFRAMQEADFPMVELGFGNYVAWVRSKVPNLPPSTCPEEWKVDDEPDPSDTQIWNALFDHTDELKALAQRHELRLLMLQPLNQFDGWPEGSERGEWVKRKVELWVKLCSRLTVDFLQVGANDQADANGGDEKTAQDMRWLAEIASKQERPFAIAYEPWCFSPRYPEWEKCYEIVKKANHPNLGLCLDTAQMCLAPSYGINPTSSQLISQETFSALLDRIRALPKETICYFEISDVLSPNPPLLQGSPFDDWHKKQGGGPERSSWVMCARAVPYVGRSAGKEVKGEEDLGVARVAEVAKAVFSTGFRGPVIWEPFEALVMEKEDPSVPQTYAQAGKVSREKLFAHVLGDA